MDTKTECIKLAKEYNIEMNFDVDDWEEIFKVLAPWGSMSMALGKTPLTEEFIEYFKDKVNWRMLSQFNPMSEAFIEQHVNDVCWTMLCKYKPLTEKFVEKNLYYIGRNNWEWLRTNTVAALRQAFVAEIDKRFGR